MSWPSKRCAVLVATLLACRHPPRSALRAAILVATNSRRRAPEFDDKAACGGQRPFASGLLRSEAERQHAPSQRLAIACEPRENAPSRLSVPRCVHCVQI
jgi:hypothetical protein